MPSDESRSFDAKRPNIVFIHAESMDGRKMGCMGHPALRSATPTLDRLATDGMLFTNAYTNCPVCNPSRASMWTGKYPHYYDCWNNHEGLRDHIPTFGTTFQAAGYDTAAIGPLDYAYGKHSIRDRVGSWTRAAHIHRPISRTPVPQVVEDGSHYGRDWNLAYRAISWMRDASAGQRPFMLYLTTGLVHPAFVAERRHMDRIDAGSIDVPPDLRSVTDQDHPVEKYIRITKNCDKQFSEPLVREIRHTYFAMIAALDELVGRVLGALDDLGLRESTYVIFSSDHGEMAGEQNQVLKRTMYESSSHVPLIVRGPGVERGSAFETPVSLVDLYPTLLDMGRIDYAEHTDRPDYPETLDGESLMPNLMGDPARTRDWAVCEYHGDRCCTGTTMLRKDNWKYLKYVGYASQLYDLERDPWERHDVAADHADVAGDMEAVLAANFDCDGIDTRAKDYDRRSFQAWRDETVPAGTYEETMARVYSGFDRLCIEDIEPWTRHDEEQIETWLHS